MYSVGTIRKKQAKTTTTAFMWTPFFKNQDFFFEVVCLKNVTDARGCSNDAV